MALRSSGILGETDFLDLGQRTHRNPVVGKRKTSWRRRAAVSEAVQAQTLAEAAGGTPVDRHKPYVYGASSQRLRDNIAKAYAAALERGEAT